MRGTVLAAVGVLFACTPSTDGVTDGDHVFEPYDVVSWWPNRGPGAEVDAIGARIAADGTLQVLVDGFACGVPTGLDLRGSEESVTIAVSAAPYDDGPCPAIRVPWFIELPTTALEGRALVDGTDGERVVVRDCRRDPTQYLCRQGK